jgi:hypothetical protein
MSDLRLPVIVLGACALLAACAPDLAVQDVTVQWDATSKQALATVANVGNLEAGEFLVYFNGDEFPESQNRRPQVSKTVQSLAAGASATLQADFAPLAHSDNNFLGRVYQVRVIADPKDVVSESNEGNNEDSAPTVSTPVTLYDKNGVAVPETPMPIVQPGLPVLFVHGHQLNGLFSQGPGYERNWQDPLDYGPLLKLPSFEIALDLPENAALGIEPYYTHFADQDLSIIEDASAIGEAIRRILLRHGDPTATQVKVVVIGFSKGTLSTRWYLKHMMPASQPVSEFVALAPPNHGLQAGASLTGSSLAFRQINNGYDDQCVPFNEAESNDFIERLNGHPIEDTQANAVQDPRFVGEAPRSRTTGAATDQGVLYVAIYADDNRDAVGGGTNSGDCQGRVFASNLAPNAVNIEVSEIAGFTPLLVHANTVHTPEVICLALYTAVHHQAPPPGGLSCSTVAVSGRDVPVIPTP